MEGISVADPERNKKLAMFHKSAGLFDETPRIQDSAAGFVETLTDLQMPFLRMTHLPKLNSQLPTPQKNRESSNPKRVPGCSSVAWPFGSIHSHFGSSEGLGS